MTRNTMMICQTSRKRSFLDELLCFYLLKQLNNRIDSFHRVDKQPTSCSIFSAIDFRFCNKSINVRQRLYSPINIEHDRRLLRIDCHLF
jgi:hypothetical protein